MSSIHHLPVEILYSILSLLPVRELIRCRCVCKAWCSFIIKPDFISTHFNLHNNFDGHILHHKLGPSGKNFFSILQDKSYVEHSSFEVPFSSETNYIKVVGSLNGLICLTDSFQLFGRTIYLWNPSIWKLKILRRSCFARHLTDHGTYFSMGFGFHYQSNDYRIVRIVYFGDVYMPLYVEKKPPRVEVYSLATNSWRRIGTNAGYYANDKLPSAFLNGAVHWFASKTREEASANVVLLFDFDSEKFREIMLPMYHEDGEGESPRVSMAVLRESLALIVCSISNVRLIKGCYIWVMREYGMAESWTKQYSIIPEERILRPLGIVNNNDFGMLMIGGELVSYDLNELDFKHLVIGGNDVTLDMVNFSESLVLYNEGFRLTPRVEWGIRLGKRKRSVFLQLQKKWR